MSNIEPLRIRPTRADEKDLPWVDHTCLKEVNTCPQWGVVHNYLRLKMPGAGRSMALEAGSACHEVFASVRLWHHMEKHDFSEISVKQATTNAVRIFGLTRTENMFEFLGIGKGDLHRRQFCLQPFYDGEFYDDPRDKKRTSANLEECLYAYISQWDRGGAPLWVQYPHDEKSLIGVELYVDVIIEYATGADYEEWCQELPQFEPSKLRYKGKADGLHLLKDGSTRVEENKTTSRITDAWIQSNAHTSHQITGYNKAMQIQYDVVCDKGKLHGLCIPLPKTYDYGGVIEEPTSRKPHHYDNWLRWALDTFENQIRPHLNKPELATMFTGSCFRYFSLCSFFPMCAGSDEEERKHTIENELESYEWDPEFG